MFGCFRMISVKRLPDWLLVMSAPLQMLLAMPEQPPSHHEATTCQLSALFHACERIVMCRSVLHTGQTAQLKETLFQTANCETDKVSRCYINNTKGAAASSHSHYTSWN